jgi:hypothetical protein
LWGGWIKGRFSLTLRRSLIFSEPHKKKNKKKIKNFKNAKMFVFDLLYHVDKFLNPPKKKKKKKKKKKQKTAKKKQGDDKNRGKTQTVVGLVEKSEAGGFKNTSYDFLLVLHLCLLVATNLCLIT